MLFNENIIYKKAGQFYQRQDLACVFSFTSAIKIVLQRCPTPTGGFDKRSVFMVLAFT